MSALAHGLDDFMQSDSPVVQDSVTEVLCPALWLLATADGTQYRITRIAALERYGSIEKFQQALTERKQRIEALR